MGGSVLYRRIGVLRRTAQKGSCPPRSAGGGTMHCAGGEEEEAVEATEMPTETRVLWGPVTKQVADAIGVPTAVASVLLRPSSATAEAAARMEALVPANILPTAGDTLKSLVARLAQSEYLHPKSVLSRGNGTGRRKYIDLNSTHYAQPRRVQWGAPMKVRRPQDEHESSSVCLPCYPHSYARSPLDTTCEVVPDAVNQLSLLLWKEARPFLAPNSTSAPPNYWEQCFYYTAFKGAMGRHRDNFRSEDLVSYLATKDTSVLTSAKYAQVPNSSVLIFTTGNAPMTLKLSYPSSRQTAGDTDKYLPHPKLSTKLSAGTLFILAPTDDLFFAHEVSFDAATLLKHGAGGYRIALVMRWIRDVHFQEFHGSGPSRKRLLVSPYMADAEDERQRKIMKKKRSRRK